MKRKTVIRGGYRFGRKGTISVGACAALFDKQKRVLLMRRSDNGQWCLPGGGMESGENLAETCLRELKEEVGIVGTVAGFIAVYSSRNWLVIFPDGNKRQIVCALFLVKAKKMKLKLSNEAMEAQFFSRNELKKLEIIPNHIQRIADAFRWKGNVICD